ncbi:hypothetical protein [Streptomyces sp. NPDC056549]|uniref:hypothetical protein n=1 Tax=Streptomyces sp. NPDC056549 TaxID=3345864 RepID=UPI0036AFBED7
MQAINNLNDHELSTLDTHAIGGVVPVHSTASARIVSLRRFKDGSSQLLVSHRFIGIILILSTLARFEISKPLLRLAINRFRAPEIAGASPTAYAAMARSAIFRDLLIQLNFHGIIASYRPRISPWSGLLFRSAVTFAMAHEAAHLLIGDRDQLEAQSSVHLRSDGSIAESKWGPELSQDRLALRLTRYAAAIPTAKTGYAPRVTPAAVNDHALSASVISLVGLHGLECAYLVGESDSHPSALDRLGSLMIEFNPMTSPQSLRYIERLLPVVDTCLFLEPLPVEAWDLLASLIRAHIIRATESRQAAVRIVESTRASDVILTARAEYPHTYDYLTSAQDTEIPDGKCLDLLRTHGRDAMPQMLDLLEVPKQSILESSAQMTRSDIARIVNGSRRIRLPSGLDRRTYVDTWANVVATAMRETPDRNRLFYELLGLREEE